MAYVYFAIGNRVKTAGMFKIGETVDIKQRTTSLNSQAGYKVEKSYEIYNISQPDLLFVESYIRCYINSQWHGLVTHYGNDQFIACAGSSIIINKIKNDFENIVYTALVALDKIPGRHFMDIPKREFGSFSEKLTDNQMLDVAYAFRMLNLERKCKMIVHCKKDSEVTGIILLTLVKKFNIPNKCITMSHSWGKTIYEIILDK